MIGVSIRLRDEKYVHVSRAFIGDLRVPMDPSDMPLNAEIHSEKVLWTPSPLDSDMQRILTEANTDPIAALRGWYEIVKCKLPKGPGARLIPSSLQDVLQTPLRQLYIGTEDDLWEIGTPFTDDEFHRPCGTIIRRLL